MSRAPRNWLVVGVVALAALAVWRIAILVHDATPEVFPRADHLAFAAVVTLGALAVVGVALRLVRAGPASIGLRSPVRGLGQGAAWYAAPVALGLIAAAFMGWGQVSILREPGEALATLLALVALVFLSEALPEELIFRGLIQTRLAALTGPWGGVLIQAALFTLFAWMVGAAATAMDIGFIAGFGVALGVLRAATGTIWAPVGFHLVFMTAQQSYGAGWDLTAVTLEPMIRTLILANLPFALVIALLFHRVGRPRAA
jgi:hypothetical protein